MGAVADGISIITENIFETRFKQIPEFRKMGAIVDIKGRTAIFEGVPKLYGAEVKAEDLRGGASLVLMGLFASVVDAYLSTLSLLYHYLRIYCK